MDTIDEVVRDFEIFAANVTRRRGEFPDVITSSIIRQIIRTRSIDTTRFIQSVDWREESVSDDSFRATIDASRNLEVTYDGFLEVDGTKRRWVGRFNYRDGIENADIQRVSDNIVNDSFRS